MEQIRAYYDTKGNALSVWWMSLIKKVSDGIDGRGSHLNER